MEANAFVGLDVHKETVSVAVAEAGRNGEVRHLGAFPNTPETVAKITRKLVGRYAQVEFAYEAGPCGYGIHRQLTSLGYVCRIVAPSTMPRRRGDRIKNDTRDAVTLARLLRAGELSFVWVPDEVHEAMRDLVRARQVAANDLRSADGAGVQPTIFAFGGKANSEACGLAGNDAPACRRCGAAAGRIAARLRVTRLGIVSVRQLGN